MKFRSTFACIALALLVLPAGSLFAQNLTTFVVVGDSLSAGVENFSLLDFQQDHSYPAVIAHQANVPLTQPRIPFPGAPNVLQLTTVNRLPVVTQVGGALVPPFLRDNPCDQPTNLAVPGVTIEQALTLLPAIPAGGDSTPQLSTDVVLGFPNPLGYEFRLCPGTPTQPLTQIQQAVALKPTTVIDYLGNNDALVPALTGALNTLTPLASFANSYEQVLDALAKTGATIITATIPDVTKVPYFTSVATLAAELKTSPAAVASRLGIGTGDLLRPSAVPIALGILENAPNPGSLSAPCPVPLPGLPVTGGIPCVLTAKDAELVRLTIDAYNVTILIESIIHGATLVDIHALVNQIAAQGVNVHVNGQNEHLTTAFLGGLFSLDGVHPTNTGYGIIANTFIAKMNAAFGNNIPLANINAIAASDPLQPDVMSYTPVEPPMQP